MASQAAATIPNTPDESKAFVLARYDERAAYYWKGSRMNKRWYKLTRLLTVVFGALVTLISSLASANFISASDVLKVTFAILTPVLAASLAVIGGISQSFQWGAAWSDMVITASHIEKERDRIAVTPADKLNPVQELDLLDDLVLKETQGFFQRLFGAGGPANNGSKTAAAE